MSDAKEEVQDAGLPLEVPRPETASSSGEARKRLALPRLAIIPLIILTLFTGSVVGIVVQPPLLRAFLEMTGLKPGSHTSNPIAVPVGEQTGISGADPEPAPTLRAVVALGELTPEGDVVTVALPYGAGDARIDQVLVIVGQQVERGDVLARLDNAGPLQATVDAVRATLALREATLDQIRAAISASRDEASATLERAEVAAGVAETARVRTQDLFDRGVTTQAVLDNAIAKAKEAAQDVRKAAVTLSRYASKDINNQPDVVVAVRNVDTARTELARARQYLARGVVTAPLDGTVLEIHVRAGEKPGVTGVADIGDIARMTAVLEVYQAEISQVAAGQAVVLTSDALAQPLTGVVADIGYSVKRQSQIGDDPAANTDARVIEVTVRLDPASSARAARLTHLEVMALITVEEEAAPVEPAQ